MHSMLLSWAVTSSLLPLSSRFHSTSEDCSSTWPVGSASFMWRQIISAPLALSINAQFISVGDTMTKGKKRKFTILQHWLWIHIAYKYLKRIRPSNSKTLSLGLHINLRTLKSLWLIARLDRHFKWSWFVLLRAATSSHNEGGVDVTDGFASLPLPSH